MLVTKLFSFFILFYFVYLSLAALGLRCCTRAFSSCSEWGLLFVAVRGSHCSGFSCCGARALGAGFSSCSSRALERRLSSCGARASLLHGMWDLPGPGLEPMFPALAGGFLTTAPPGKSLSYCLEGRLQTLLFILYSLMLGLGLCKPRFYFVIILLFGSANVEVGERKRMEGWRRKKGLLDLPFSCLNLSSSSH